MKVTRLELHNINSFPSKTELNFSENINILIGENNSGKSTILKCIHTLQTPSISPANIMVGTHDKKSYFILDYKGEHPPFPKSGSQTSNTLFRYSLHDNSRLLITNNTSTTQVGRPSSVEPYNLIYPYLSKRKTVNYEQTINQGVTNSVTGNVSNLYAKIDRLHSPKHRGHAEYVQACQDILGFEISTYPTDNGKQAVYYLENKDNDDLIPMNQMGEGVSNILGLVTDLCVAKDNIFLIEELENDIHPKALKSLLELILKKSQSNQFFVSTHSNIVMRVLGAADNSKVIEVVSSKSDPTRPNLYLSSTLEINTPEKKQRVLSDLGYEFSDLGIWKSWLFLEESSAERIIREFLIPWFTPELEGKLRTFSASSISEIEVKFRDFNRLFVFTHLEESYKNHAWVYIDAGDREEKIIQSLRETYKKSGWNENNFNQFSKHDFESYYPDEFYERKKEISNADRKDKQALKVTLLKDLITWIKEDENRAKCAFKDSAQEIIKILESIRKEIL